MSLDPTSAPSVHDHTTATHDTLAVALGGYRIYPSSSNYYFRCPHNCSAYQAALKTATFSDLPRFVFWTTPCFDYEQRLKERITAENQSASAQHYCCWAKRREISLFWSTLGLIRDIFNR